MKGDSWKLIEYQDQLMNHITKFFEPFTPLSTTNPIEKHQL